MSTVQHLSKFELTDTEKHMLRREVQEVEFAAEKIHRKAQEKLIKETFKDIKKPEWAIFDVKRFDTDF